MKRSCSCVALLVLLTVAATAQDDPPTTDAGADESVSYYQDIRPIFQAHCHGCHQPAKRGGEYDMTNFAELLAGGDSGDRAVVPHKPDESYLVRQITPDEGQAEMPQEAEPLSESERDLIVKWIRQGAKDDTPVSAKSRYDMQHPPTYVAPPVITSLDFSPDGKWLAVSGYHEVVVHHADGSGVATRLVGLSERIESAVFSPDGKRLAVTGGSPGRMGELQVWDVAERELLLSKTIGYDTCYGGSWSADGKLVAFGCPDTAVRVVNVDTGEQVLFNAAHDDWVLDTTFSAKSDHVVTVSRDRSMKLIHLDTQRFIDNITSITPGALKGGLNSIERHPAKDELLTGGADGAPKIYRMIREKARKIGDDFNLVRAFPAMPGRLFAVAFNHDGTRIVAGSSYNTTGQVQVYNVADAKVVSTAEIEGGIFAVDFHPDGKRVAAGGYGGQVYLLDAEKGEVIKKFYPVPLQPETSTTQNN